MTQVLSPSTDQDRIQFRTPASRIGSVDGAWWPRSLDLAVELPALLAGLWADGHEITRVTYNLGTWGRAPRRIAVDGRVVRLGGFATGDPNSIKLSDAWRRESIDVLVIPPGTDAALAQRILTLAATAENPENAAQILDRAASAGSR